MNDATGQPQSVLVLGGTSDIAVALVAALAKHRCRRAVLAGRNEEALQKVAEGLGSLGIAETEVVHWDAAEVAAHRAVLGEVFDRPGGIDMVVAAAGVLGDQASDATDPISAADVMTINYTGMASALLVVAERMVEQGYGTIVVLSSVAGVRVRQANFIYGSSKAALDGFAQGLGDSLAPSGVRVMIVRPGFVKSKMTKGLAPVPMSTTPEAVAAEIIDGLGRGRDVVWAPRKLQVVFAILKLLPRPIFRRIPG